MTPCHHHRLPSGWHADILCHNTPQLHVEAGTFRAAVHCGGGGGGGGGGEGAEFEKRMTASVLKQNSNT